MTDPATIEAAVSAYVLTAITRTGRRPLPDDVATFRMYVERALRRGGGGGQPNASPSTRGGARADGDDDDGAITRPTRPHPRPPR